MMRGRYSAVMVSGGAGFIGRHLLDLLSQAENRPDRVVVLDVRRPEGWEGDWTECDLTDPHQVGPAVAQVCPDVIVHLAGIAAGGDLDAFLSVNVLACNHLLSSASKLPRPPRMLVMGSAAQYGITTGGQEVVDESRPLLGQTPYGVSKTFQERWALLRGREESVPVVCVRPFNIMGPGQPDRLVPATFLRQVADVKAGRSSEVVVGNLATSRDFLDVRDVCSALWALMTAPPGEPDGQVFNIASGEPLRIQQLLNACVELGGGGISVRPDPSLLKAGDVPMIVGNAERLRSMTGWRPRIPWRQSLEDMWREQIARAQTGP